MKPDAVQLLVKMFRYRSRKVLLILGDPLPNKTPKPKPAPINIIDKALKIKSFLDEDTQRKHIDAACHFKVSRARISQLMMILEKLPDDFISIMKTTEDQSLLKRFSGKTMIRIAALSTPEQRQVHIESIRTRP